MKYRLITLSICALLLTTLATFWFAIDTKDTQLSAKPVFEFSGVSLQPEMSTLGLQTTIPFTSIQLAAENATEQKQTGSGERQHCKKLLGTKVCATVQWQYQVTRSDRVTLNKENDYVRMTLPLQIDGSLSIDGRGGKLLGLRNKTFSGQLEIRADLNANLAANWCPQLSSKLSYRWLSDPQIHLTNKLKISMRKQVDKALNKKIISLQKTLGELVDCNLFRKTIATYWRTHYLPVELSPVHQAFLKLVPEQAAVNRTRIEQDHISIAVELLATTEMVTTIPEPEKRELPDLTTKIPSVGAVEFSVLLRLPYAQLAELLSTKLIGKVLAASDRLVKITELNLYPSGNRIVFDVGFSLSGPSILGGWPGTFGRVYLSGRPEVETANNSVRFEDLQFTRIVDSQMWAVVSTVLHQRLLLALQNNPVVNFDAQVQRLEQSIAETLANPDNTAGINLIAEDLQVQLIALNPEATALAAIVRASTMLEAVVPGNVLFSDN